MRKRLGKIDNFTIESEGAVELLDRKTCSFLLSRQSRRPEPEDWWVNAVRDAARWASVNDMVAVTGGGLIHLDFARWASHSFGPVVYVDISYVISARTTGAGAAPDHWCDLRLVPKADHRMTKNELLHARDALVADLSYVLVAVAVRKGGLMERIGLEALASGKKVLALEPPSRSKEYAGNWNLLDKGAAKLHLEIHHPERLQPTGYRLKPTASNLLQPTVDYLWHFTRECPGPWLGESWGGYFSELAAGAPGSGHSALDTLARILSEERIRACGRMIRGGFPVVCWSGAEPSELIKRRRYRHALVRWEFQPYAIGIRREIAEKLGLERIICMSPHKYSSTPERDRFRFQAQPKGGARWSEEEEWRNPGDFLLTDLHPSEGAVLVNSHEEIARVLPGSRFPVISMSR